MTRGHALCECAASRVGVFGQSGTAVAGRGGRSGRWRVGWMDASRLRAAKLSVVCRGRVFSRYNLYRKLY